ncbi:hypothetical protein DSO57_1003560 [Entomophthora muscae]|uniref:Uncharacterized protein n=1 Tax=Entomophthora muscae TaxID=34485 RepID=A0ACC2RZL2_9FUNG|nr:hypothetical protein DSO57_1003560 [Entomophthora muscae]
MSTKRKSEGQPAVAKKAPKSSSEIHPFFKNSKRLNESSGCSESDESKVIWGFEGNSDKLSDSLLIGRTRDFSFSGFASVLALDLDGTIIKVKGTHVTCQIC